MIRYRKATLDDMIQFWGHAPPYTVKFMRAVVNDNDEPISIGGIAFDKALVTIWMEWDEEALKYPIALVKACLSSMHEAHANGYHLLYAVAKCETAERFLKTLGMVHIDNSANGAVYKCHG